MRNNFKLIIALIPAVMSFQPLLAQDTSTIVVGVERTTEPTATGNGASVVRNTVAQTTIDLNAKGRQGYDTQATRVQTIETGIGAVVTITKEVVGRGDTQVSVQKSPMVGKPAGKRPIPGKPG